MNEDGKFNQVVNKCKDGPDHGMNLVVQVVGIIPCIRCMGSFTTRKPIMLSF